jgi:hypothetical protein
VGGLLAVLTRGWLVIQLLWIDRKYRKRGIGDEFMRLAEALAVKRRCRWSRVETGENQAPKFYPKYGYRCIKSMRFSRSQRGFFFTKRLGLAIPSKFDPKALQARCGVSVEASEVAETAHRRVLTALAKRMNAFVTRNIEPLHMKRIDLEARDRRGRLVGGLVGSTYWDWAQFDVVWAKDTGVEEALLYKAESEVHRRGSRHVLIEAYDFQMPLYGKRLGYRPCVIYKNAPKGHIRFYLLKTLKRNETFGRSG